MKDPGRVRFEDLFIERDELPDEALTEVETMNLQVQSLLGELSHLSARIDGLCDRVRYYSDELKVEDIRELQHTLKRLMRDYA